jgi:hypothetical protein
MRILVVGAVLLALAFMGGFIPKEMERRAVAEKLGRAELDLRLANLHRELGMASHEAQRNNFGVAEATARRFFDGCRSLAREADFEGQPRTKLALDAYAASGDIVLGELANADPTVKERLAGLYVTMNGVLERRN